MHGLRTAPGLMFAAFFSLKPINVSKESADWFHIISVNFQDASIFCGNNVDTSNCNVKGFSFVFVLN